MGRPSASTSWMRRPCGVFSVITWWDRLARSGLLVELALAPPWVWPLANAWVGEDGEGGDCFCITDWAPPAWALSSPITLPPKTPPEPDTVWAMDWGAK